MVVDDELILVNRKPSMRDIAKDVKNFTNRNKNIETSTSDYAFSSNTPSTSSEASDDSYHYNTQQENEIQRYELERYFLQ